jgi:hypothetical protein
MIALRTALGSLLVTATAISVSAQQQPNIQDLLQAFSQGGQGAAVELVDFRELKKLMPEEIEELKRSGLSGEKTSGPLGNFSVVTVEATYAGEDGATLALKVTDLGAMPTIGAMAQFGWANAEVDRETDELREYTTEIQGHRGYVKYNRKYRTGNTSIMADGRLTFEIRGRQVSKEIMDAAAEALPVKKMLALVPGAGAEEGDGDTP